MNSARRNGDSRTRLIFAANALLALTAVSAPLRFRSPRQTPIAAG